MIYKLLNIKSDKNIPQKTTSVFRVFKELGISIDEILSKHESIKEIRAEDWAKEINHHLANIIYFLLSLCMV